MQVRRLVPVVFGLALMSVAAVVAGSPPVSKSKPTMLDCPTPDADECKSEGYLESVCGLRHAQVCKQPVTDAMKAYYNQSPAPTIPMLGPNEHRLPGDIQQGKYIAYQEPPKLSKVQLDLGKLYRKVGDPLRAHLPMANATTAPVPRLATVNPATAAQYHREPSWAANGKRVESCAEYAYERNHDVVRFIDAASACRGDRECVWDVAYMASTPGIAKRTLVDTDGRALPKLRLAEGTFPKNDLFVLGAAFVRANGTQMMAVTQEMRDLEAALTQGQNWYEIGKCSGNKCSTRKFANEWTWHEHLHGKNANVSEAEAEEYARRRAEFRELLEQWHTAVKAEHAKLMQGEVADIVLPFDMRTNNPFERYGIEQQYLDRSVNLRNEVKQKFGAGILDMSMKDALNKAQGKAKTVGAWTGGAGAVAGVLAAPAPTPKPTAAGSTTTSPTTAPSQQPSQQPSSGGNKALSPCVRQSGWGLEMNFRGPLSCKVGEFLRHEWARKQAGQRSCLDLGNAGCDWSPDTFEAAILDAVPLLDQQLADERTCKAWSDGVTVPADSVAQVTARLAANEAAFKEIWPKVKEFDQGRTSAGQKFGKDWGGGDYIGDKDWFGVGYDYDVGWDAAPLKQDEGIICELGGSLHANMGFDAWIVGSKAEVVDGAVRAEANHASSGKVRYKAHLEMFDQTVFSTSSAPGGWRVAQAFAPDPDQDFGIRLPKPKPRFDIYVGVPISGELWGELLFGSDLSASGKASNSCNASNPEFAIGATYTPFFGAYAIGQVGVGISGVVSAGIRATLTLLTVGLPVEVGMRTKTSNNKQSLTFDSQISLSLATLAGRVSLYIEFLVFEEEFELFRWSGVGPVQAPLMPKLQVDVPLAGMK